MNNFIGMLYAVTCGFSAWLGIYYCSLFVKAKKNGEKEVTVPRAVNLWLGGAWLLLALNNLAWVLLYFKA